MIRTRSKQCGFACKLKVRLERNALPLRRAELSSSQIQRARNESKETEKKELIPVRADLDFFGLARRG